MSRGYPTRSAQNRIYRFLMYFGGQPSHTYTTIRLHSPPTLLSGARLNVRSLGGPVTGGFTSVLSTPISIYTADTGYIYVEAPKPSRAQQGASFLFSFEGKVIYSNQATLPNFPLQNYDEMCWQHGGTSWPIWTKQNVLGSLNCNIFIWNTIQNSFKL